MLTCLFKACFIGPTRVFLRLEVHLIEPVF
jgi:hypothetical protein